MRHVLRTNLGTDDHPLVAIVFVRVVTMVQTSAQYDEGAQLHLRIDDAACLPKDPLYEGLVAQAHHVDLGVEVEQGLQS